MCEYCRKNGKRKNILEDKELIVKIKKDRILGYSIRVEQENIAIATNINYCPMCGSRLERGVER